MTAKSETPRMRIGRCSCRFRYTTRLFDRHHELLEPCGYHATQSRENATLRERLERAEKALWKFGAHEPKCGFRPLGVGCFCGYADALAGGER